MRTSIPRTLATAVILAGITAGFALAQTTPPGPGFHAVALPAPSSNAQRVESRVLLQTPHLKLVSIVVPKGTVLPAHSAPNQVSIQALSGAGEVRFAGRSERVDGTHMVVLAPGVEHEARAAADADLVLLVHHMLAGPRGPGRGPGPGRGAGPGPGPAPGRTP
jgi:quercetin dioxygenase-like cupin family protein